MKKYSSKHSIRIAAHILQQFQIKDIVISPGSRNAPIAIHLAENDYFNCYSIVDERSAAFVGLGMAVQTKKPVVLCCTSGSAAANYYPAITEAFYANVPLLILTADRPADYVDLFDGQTIRQNKIFQQHSYGDFELLDDSEENADDINFRTVQTAVELCIKKQGPVHINVPLKEPLYDFVNEIALLPSVEIISDKKDFQLKSTLVADWNLSKRILILVGSLPKSAELEMLLSQLVKNHSAVVLCEANSNLKNDKFFKHIDRFIYNFTDDDVKMYAPDLLITVGQNVVSKKVKQFLRKAMPKNHWHIDKFWHPDTYFVLNQKLETSAENFFSKLLNDVKLEPSPYYNLWNNLREKADEKHNDYIAKTDFSDFYLFYLLSLKIPSEYVVFFSNSSAIRYAQLFDYQNEIHCNRGTSGIDGCTSTAMGFAVKSPKPTVLVTGDISFFYDINGLWNAYLPPFTRIIIFNNGEGNIFKIIPGPERANTDIVDEFVATKHHRNAELLAKSFGFSYSKVNDDLTLERVLDNFFKPDSQPKILEVNTAEIENAEILKRYFASLV